MAGSAVSGTAAPDSKTIDDHLAVQAIIRSYQVTKQFPRNYYNAYIYME